MESSLVYLLFAGVAASADVGGGLVLFHPKAKGLSPRYLIGLASGILVSAAFFELIPESNVVKTAPFMALGFFVFYFIEKVIMIHACGEKECEAHTVGWIAVVGMASDNIVDGIGIAIGYLTNPFLGIVITIAVVIHELPQGITTAAIMKSSGFRPRKIILTLIIAGLTYPLGAGLSGFMPSQWYQYIIAFVAGDFIYIGAADLLAEAHKRFNLKVVLAVILGGLIPAALGLIE